MQYFLKNILIVENEIFEIENEKCTKVLWFVVIKSFSNRNVTLENV